MTWTQFMDMHSGGRTKVKNYEYIYIEAPKQKAIEIFEEKFSQNPNDVACCCCGENFSLSESETLEQASGYERHCRYDDALKKYVEEQGQYGDYETLENYMKKLTVLIISQKDLK